MQQNGTCKVLYRKDLQPQGLSATGLRHGYGSTVDPKVEGSSPFGVSEDVEQILDKAKKSGVQPSRLDHILRQNDQVERRLSWTQMEVKDGWAKMSELPDASNLHLVSARALAQEAESDPDSLTKPLSCVILSACAVEAFINQVAYFLNDIKNYPEAKYHTIPSELEGDAMSFQRYTELSQKWDILGKELCCPVQKLI